jgi:mRNA interferase RelE/StbE
MSEPEQWTVTYHRDLEREIRRLPRPFIKRILETIESLAADPRPPGCKKIEGHHFWRVQVGVYRILYQIDEENRVINTYRIGHRRDVYRNL